MLAAAMLAAAGVIGAAVIGPGLAAGRPTTISQADAATSFNATISNNGADASASQHDPGITGPAGTLSIPTLVATPAEKSTAADQLLNLDTSLSAACYYNSAPPFTSACGADPVGFTRIVVYYATVAGIDPRLLMAVLFNERGVHWQWLPHTQFLEDLRVLGQALGVINSGGLANMSQQSFDQVKQGRDFADRSWSDLASDPILAIEAAAYLLHDLEGQLPATWTSTYKRDELVAMGYNRGPVKMNLVAGPAGGSPAQAPDQVDLSGGMSWYVSQVDANWPGIDQLICQSGLYTCSL